MCVFYQNHILKFFFAIKLCHFKLITSYNPFLVVFWFYFGSLLFISFLFSCHFHPLNLLLSMIISISYNNNIILSNFISNFKFDDTDFLDFQIKSYRVTSYSMIIQESLGLTIKLQVILVIIRL